MQCQYSETTKMMADGPTREQCAAEATQGDACDYHAPYRPMLTYAEWLASLPAEVAAKYEVAR